MSSKKTAEDPAVTLQQLKRLRDDYNQNCKLFVSEPLISKRLDKAVQLNEPVEKIILTGMSVPLSPNDIYALANTFQAYTVPVYFSYNIAPQIHLSVDGKDR